MQSPRAYPHLPIWLVILFVFVIQVPTVTTSFCGFDDFNETFRAEFEDSAQPSRMLTTPHFDSFKYRPGNRILTWLCDRVGQGSAWPFRWRNVLMHLLNVYLVYRLTRFLFGGAYIAATAAFLFGLHHLVHQNVHAAIFTNTWAYALVLLSLLSALSIAESRRWLLLSVLSSIATFLAIFSYDPALFSAGLLILYEACYWLFHRRARTPLPRLLIHTTLQTAAVSAMFILRKIYVPLHLPELTPPGTVLQIVLTYAAAIAIPVDTVSIQTWIDAPITKELAGQHLLIYIVAAVLAVIVSSLSWLAYRFGWHKHLSRTDLSGLLFLGGAALLSVLPTSLGSPHASETYVYFATALSMPLLCLVAIRLLRMPESRRGTIFFQNSFWILIILFCLYDMTRSYMVLECGNVSKRVLSALAADPRIAAGSPLVAARAPGDPPVRHVGLYGYVGLDTIGVGPFAAAALRSALSTALHRTPIQVEVLSPPELNTLCLAAPVDGRQPACVFVHSDGFIEPWQPRPSF